MTEKTKLFINGIDCSLRIPLKFIDNRFYIPVDAFRKLFNARVVWDKEHSTVRISFNLKKLIKDIHPKKIKKGLGIEAKLTKGPNGRLKPKAELTLGEIFKATLSKDKVEAAIKLKL